MSSSKLFLFSKEVHFISGVRLLLELYCAVVIKHVAFFTILAKLTVVFTCTSLPLNLYTSIFGCGCGFGFEQKFWQIDGFGEKKARIGGFAYPYSPPSVKKSYSWETSSVSVEEVVYLRLYFTETESHDANITVESPSEWTWTTPVVDSSMLRHGPYPEQTTGEVKPFLI